MNRPRLIHLIPPLLEDQHIKDRIVCIRAHRERIFKLSAEFNAGKLICHNYGHGGAGYTFLFGCVDESIKQFEQTCAEHPYLKNKPIAVVGAGCHGLLTAIRLARSGFQVRVIAKEIHDLPSYKAAGFFFPRPRKVSDAPEREQFLKLGIHSYATYQLIAHGAHDFIKAGARLVPAYYDPAIDPGFAPYIERGLIKAHEQVMISFDGRCHYAAHEYTVAHINARELMAELHAQIQELAIPLALQEIDSFDDVEENIIFNCAGLGAKKLAHDARVIPIQGHLITLTEQPPNLTYMINMRVVQNTPAGSKRDELIYFAPKDEGILGITFIRGQDSLTANAHEFDRLLERSRKFFSGER